MPATLDDLKTDLRIDGSADDTLLQRYLNAAETYIKNAVCDTTDAGNAAFFNTVDDLYSTAVLALASTYYEYRSSLTCVNIKDVDPVVNGIVGQLQAQFEVWSDKNNAKN